MIKREDYCNLPAFLFVVIKQPERLTGHSFVFGVQVIAKRIGRYRGLKVLPRKQKVFLDF